MKIAHIGLASFYTDGMAYQENYLTEQNVRDGHQVLFVSNAAKYENGKVVETGYEDIVLPSGVRLVRLPYEHVINSVVTEKFRRVKGLYKLLGEFAPDVILCHDLCYYSVLDVIRYRKEHPEVKLYADSHTDYGNSGKNWVSLHILHKIYYRYLIQKALPYLEKYLYIVWSVKLFSEEVYGVPESLLEFFPLGSRLPAEEEYRRSRQSVRSKLKIADGEYLFIHTGKLEPGKKTEMLLKAFSAVPELRAKLAVIGFIPDDMKDVLCPLIEKDSRIVFLGWKNAEELERYLCGCDLYLQPGSGSVTMQSAVCRKCPVLSYPHEYYIHGYDYGNILWTENEADIQAAFRKISSGETDLAKLAENSERCAKELLDYRVIAARLYR